MFLLILLLFHRVASHAISFKVVPQVPPQYSSEPLFLRYLLTSAAPSPTPPLASISSPPPLIMAQLDGAVMEVGSIIFV